MSPAATIQIPLLKPERLDPLPISDGHYVAALQNKPGELNALRNASSSTWACLTPLINVVGPKTPKDPLTASSVAAWVKRLAAAVGDHPFYLDIMRLNPTLKAADKHGGVEPALAAIYGQARKRQMHFVPVVHVGESSAAHVGLVADASLEDGHGVALRYRMLKVLPPPGMNHKDFLEAQLAALGSQPEDADLLVDLEYLDEDAGIDPQNIATALNEMCSVGEWRCLVVIGTSIPSMMSCITEGTVGSIPRREWDLWSRLSGCGLVRVPAFGDYAVQHPHPPLDAGGNTMRANIRYTDADETIVARGRGPLSQEGNEQYCGLCQQLVARQEFAGAPYSWGDSVIHECATGSREPGSQSMWRGAGTSHHLQVVTDRVQELHKESQTGVSASEPAPDPE